MGKHTSAVEILEGEKCIQQRNTVVVSADAALFEMNRYEAFIKDMNANSHIERVMIRDRDTAYIQTFKVKSGAGGKIIELRCPSSNVISIFGKNQTVLLLENEPKKYDIKFPYFFSLRCYDNSNRELNPATRMNFKKISKHGGISRKWRATYGDLSPAYSFPEGLYLNGDEVLELQSLNPDIDIERIELSMETDVFGPETRRPPRQKIH